MIAICTCCNQNTAGQHEIDCPCNPNKIVPTVSSCYACAVKDQRIAKLESENAALRELVKEARVIMGDCRYRINFDGDALERLACREVTLIDAWLEKSK